MLHQPLQMDLSTFFNKSGCECLNEADDHPLAHCLTTKGGYLESDCDEQVGCPPWYVGWLSQFETLTSVCSPFSSLSWFIPPWWVVGLFPFDQFVACSHLICGFSLIMFSSPWVELWVVPLGKSVDLWNLSPLNGSKNYQWLMFFIFPPIQIWHFSIFN